jgi:hypothetical protein
MPPDKLLSHFDWWRTTQWVTHLAACLKTMAPLLLTMSYQDLVQVIPENMHTKCADTASDSESPRTFIMYQHAVKDKLHEPSRKCTRRHWIYQICIRTREVIEPPDHQRRAQYLRDVKNMFHNSTFH